jgi:hypothetical protein
VGASENSGFSGGVASLSLVDSIGIEAYFYVRCGRLDRSCALLVFAMGQ